MELRNLLTDFNILMLEIIELVPKYKENAIKQLEDEIKSLKQLKEKIHGRNSK